MATTIGHESKVSELLKHLVELDYDAIEAYRAAIDRLETASDKQVLTSFLRDHERHTIDVGRVIRDLGETPPTGGDLKRVLTKGKVVMAGLAGDDAVLKAMRSNEEDTNAAYERAAGRADLAPHVQELLRRNLEDERRHRAWLVQRLEARERGAG